MQIIPGMTAQAQIRTGEKSIMEYVLKPLAKSKEAFRER
jgi:adhesin transport system membrane fusion protein